MLGVIGLHMKVHRHLRATGSPQSIKVKNVTGLPSVAVTYGFSHDQSFTHTHSHRPLTCFSVLIWSAHVGIHVVRRSRTNGMKFMTNYNWFNKSHQFFTKKNLKLDSTKYFLSLTSSLFIYLSTQHCSFGFDFTCFNSLPPYLRKSSCE